MNPLFSKTIPYHSLSVNLIETSDKNYALTITQTQTFVFICWVLLFSWKLITFSQMRVSNFKGKVASRQNNGPVSTKLLPLTKMSFPGKKKGRGHFQLSDFKNIYITMSLISKVWDFYWTPTLNDDNSTYSNRSRHYNSDFQTIHDFLPKKIWFSFFYQL